MDHREMQGRLEALYSDWKATLRFNVGEADNLVAPFLLHVTDEYCRAQRRVLVFGQETGGWGWDNAEQAKHSADSDAWMFQDISSCTDFLNNQDSIEALCWAYRDFQFGASYPSTYWRAVKEVRKWPGVGVMASNVMRMAYLPPTGKDKAWGLSALQAPPGTRDSLISQQAGLFAAELALLKPHVCLFFSGPNYDGVIKAMLPGLEILTCCEVPARKLAKLIDPALPSVSFRTYHPRFLSTGKYWHYIDAIRSLSYGA